MDLFLNILITIIFSILTCITYDFVKSYLLTRKLKDLNTNNSWNDFWNNNIPTDNDFEDKEKEYE